MFKVLITTIPFGDKNSLPLEMLEEVNIKYLINPINKKLTEDELIELVDDFDVIIAGTEPITDRVMSNLKMISHVVVGLGWIVWICWQHKNGESRFSSRQMRQYQLLQS
jgi:D-3-phosphoglycerate dehydrogenase